MPHAHSDSHDTRPTFFGAAEVPVLTAAEMQAWDRGAIDRLGIPQPVLMESAGRAAAAAIHRLHPRGRVLVMAGSGNNGGDGMVVARTLAAWGRDVSILTPGRAPDAALLHGWDLPLFTVDDVEAELAGADVVVDALLGTGSTGAPRAPLDGVIREMNGAGRPIVALDGPSGVDFTTGAADGVAVDADATVTFGAPKRGLLLFPGRAHAGRIITVEIGFPPLEPDAAGALLITPAWAAARLPAVPPNAHKGQMGRVVILAGRAGMAGASVLAGTGALRAGAGMVVLVAPEANRVILQATLPEALYEERESVDDDVFAAADSIVAGPGMGTDDASLALLRTVLETSRCPVLLDADAVTLLARTPALRDAARGPLLLTPHPGEMARLLGTGTAAVVRDPFAAAARAAERYQCTVLLKGAPGIVAQTGEPALVSVGGHGGIATGGMGDTLSGVVGAVLARVDDPRTAAAVGLYYCSRAAELAGRGRGIIPRDVDAALPYALLESPSTESDLGLPCITLDLRAAY